MLMYGPASAADIKFGGKGVMYNLSSMREGFISLQALIPPNTIGRLTDREFDIAYANYIMSNDTLFCIFFQIVYNLYIGKDVFIIVSTEDWSENLLESLLKLIQQRYGIRSYIINDICDIDPFALSDFETEIGYQNYLRDVEWYLTMKQRG